MLAAQEEARQVTSAVCSENDMLRAKLQQLGIDPNLDLNVKSTPELKGQPLSARRAIEFPERKDEPPKPPPRSKIGASDKINDKTFQNPPLVNQLFSRRPFNPKRRDVNAFTASGATEYKDLPPLHPRGKVGQSYNATNNQRATINTHFDRFQNPSNRNRHSEEFVGGPQFSSTHRHSDGPYRLQNRGRSFPHGRTTRFQSPTMNQDSRTDPRGDRTEGGDRRNTYRDRQADQQERRIYENLRGDNREIPDEMGNRRTTHR